MAVQAHGKIWESDILVKLLKHDPSTKIIDTAMFDLSRWYNTLKGNWNVSIKCCGKSTCDMGDARRVISYAKHIAAGEIITLYVVRYTQVKNLKVVNFMDVVNIDKTVYDVLFGKLTASDVATYTNWFCSIDVSEFKKYSKLKLCDRPHLIKAHELDAKSGLMHTCPKAPAPAKLRPNGSVATKARAPRVQCSFNIDELRTQFPGMVERYTIGNFNAKYKVSIIASLESGSRAKKQ